MNASDIKNRNFAIAGIVCAGVSIMVGGTFLDVVGIVFGGLAYSRSRKSLAANPANAEARNAFRLARIALITCSIAAVLNLLAAIFLMPAILEQAQSMVGATTGGGSVF